MRIHLSQTAAGLLARITADTPVASQALAQGRAELHRSLSSLGVSLVRFELGSFGQSHEHAPRSGAAPAELRGSRAPEEEADDPSQGTPNGAPAGAVSARTGSLVDVLA